MACNTQKEFLEHHEHNIEIAYYGDKNNPVSVTIECTDCNEVLIDIED